MIIPPGPLTSLTPQYQFETTLGGQIKVTNLTKDQVYLFPTSYKGHITAELLAKIESFCDTKSTGSGLTIFYASVHYAERSVPNQLKGKIVHVPKEELANKITKLGAISLSNNEATQELEFLLQKGKFHTPNEIRKIHQLLDSGASESLLINLAVQTEDLVRFKVAYDLLADRNGSEIFKSSPLFEKGQELRDLLAQCDELSVANLIEFLKGNPNTSIEMRKKELFQYKVMNTKDASSYRLLVEEYQGLIELENLRANFKSFIETWQNEPVLLARVANASSLSDFIAIDETLQKNLSADALMFYKLNHLYNLRDLEKNVKVGVRYLSSLLDENSPQADVVIKIGDEAIFTNRVFLTKSSPYFENAFSSRFLQPTDGEGRRVFDFSEEALSNPGIEFILKEHLGKKYHAENTLIKNYFIVKGLDYFDFKGSDVEDNSDFIQRIDYVLPFFANNDLPRLINFLNFGLESNITDIEFALHILHPKLDLVLPFDFFESKSKLIEVCSLIFQAEPLYESGSIEELFKYLDTFARSSASAKTIKKYYLSRICDLNSPDFNSNLSVLKNVSDSLENNFKFKIINTLLQQIAEDPSLQNMVIKIDNQEYLTNANFLAVFGGDYIKGTLSFESFKPAVAPLSAAAAAAAPAERVSVSIDRSPLLPSVAMVDLDLALADDINPFLKMVFLKEVFQIEKLPHVKDLRNLFLIDMAYDYLGINHANWTSQPIRDIISSFQAGDFDESSFNQIDMDKRAQVLKFLSDELKLELQTNPGNISRAAKFIEILRNKGHLFFDERTPASSATADRIQVEKDRINEAAYFRSVGLDISKIDKKYLPTLSKIAHRGDAEKYSASEIDEVLNCIPALPFLLHIINYSDPNLPLGRLIAERFAVKVKHALKTFKSKEDKNFLNAFKELNIKIKVLNFSALTFKDLPTLNFLLKYSSVLRIEYPKGVIPREWLINKKEIVADDMDSLRLIMGGLSSDKQVFFRHAGNFHIPFGFVQRFLGNGETLNITTPCYWFYECKFYNFVIDHLEGVFNEGTVNSSSIVFETCELNAINISSNRDINLTINNCSGRFQFEGRFNIIEVHNTVLSENQLLYLAEHCKELKLDYLPELSPEARKILDKKLSFI